MKKNTLIYGGGAIGSFLAVCLVKSGHTVYFLSRGKNYKVIKSNGLKIKVYNNSSLKKKFFLEDGKNFQLIKNLKEINIKKFDNIFITTKINEDLKKMELVQLF